MSEILEDAEEFPFGNINNSDLQEINVAMKNKPEAALSFFDWLENITSREKGKSFFNWLN